MIYYILKDRSKDEKANLFISGTMMETLKGFFGSGATRGRKAMHPPRYFGGQASCRN
jgi:hypothetical protein